jgi:hypothetical protein
MLPKLSAAYYAVMMMFHICNIDTLQMIYFVYFHSVIKYEIFWGEILQIDRVFTSLKRMIKIRGDMRSKSLCRRLFKELDTLPVPCQYIFSLICFRLT